MNGATDSVTDSLGGAARSVRRAPGDVTDSLGGAARSVRRAPGDVTDVVREVDHLARVVSDKVGAKGDGYHALRSALEHDADGRANAGRRQAFARQVERAAS
jgi:hypothetical protein